MSEHENKLFNSKHNNFRKYLKEFDVIESLTKVIANLYELEEKPIDPLDYIRTHMTKTIKEREELKILKTKHDHMVTEIHEMEEENINLAKEIKRLENYGEDYESKLITDEEDI